MGKTYYTCPCCERRVWVYSFWGAAWVGSICNDCQDDHGNSTSSYCSVIGPAKRRREAAEREARRIADRRRREEEERVRKRAAELEKLQRARQKARETERKRKRDLEQKALKKKRKNEAAERDRNKQEMEDALKKTMEELEREAGKLQKSKLQNKDPFLQYKQLHTLRTMKTIGKQVNEVAVVGEIVKERVSEISQELQDTLNDDYKLIEKEMDRYKEYGEEMANMTNVFKTELGKAFTALSPDIATDSVNLQNDANEYDKEIEFLIDNADDEDYKKYYQKKKNSLQNRINRKLDVVDDAMNAIQVKLNIMESYYMQMMEDYKYFEKFINTKDDELAQAINYFQDVARQLKQSPDRSKLFVSKTSKLYEEYKSDEQILSFTEDYEYKKLETTGINMGDAIVTGVKVGGTVGAVGGAVVGGLAAGPVGAVAGGITWAIGGAIWGAGIGAIVSLCNPQKCSYTTKTGIVTVNSELIAYENKKQADALQKIVKKIQQSKTYKKMQNELAGNRKLANEQRDKLQNLKTQMMKVQQPLINYKYQMKELKKTLKNGNNTTNDDAIMIDKKLQEFSAKMQFYIKTMT
eukprot:300247_1